MSDILEKIIATKHEEVAQRKASKPLDSLRERIESASPARGFAERLGNAAREQQPGVIAEIKKASPSKGVIRENFDPIMIAQDYERAGATCLSVLTDEQYFQGSDQYLSDVRQSVELPVIRKDFTIDEYQLYEARALGADAVLLIVAALNIMQLTVLYQTARSIGLDVLIEVHNKTELEAALSLNPNIIGINNRNLKTFETNLSNTVELLEHIPTSTTVVTESGIARQEDVALMLQNDVFCFLVGEAFMRAPSPGDALQNLFTT